REIHSKLFKERFDIDLHVEATHGGLECGVFWALQPEMDIICFGPVGGGAHTPEEWLDIKSFGEIYEYLKYFLEQLTK
ncbi:MAG: M20/M25/M40 family metallo-hydrolase, partial [Anaerotignum sp.]|nr:M20/M25/M40 family metallo-hydrolase [Anaerotignum sp.]